MPSVKLNLRDPKSTRFHESDTGTNNPLYNNKRWAKLSLFIRTNEPLCRLCKAKGRITKAQSVDHIRPERLFPELFWDQSNLQPLCHRCHMQKTGKDQKFTRRDEYEMKNPVG